MSRAQEYLEQIGIYDVMIDEMVAEMDLLKAKAYKITSTMQDVPAFSGGAGDKVGDGAAALVDLAREIDEATDNFVNLKREAADLLKKIRKAKYYKVLSMKYFRYMTFQQIGDEMNCSKRNAEKIHGRALQVFDKLLAEKEAKQMKEE